MDGEDAEAGDRYQDILLTSQCATAYMFLLRASMKWSHFDLVSLIFLFRFRNECSKGNSLLRCPKWDSASP